MRRPTVVLLAFALALAGCGDDSAGPGPTETITAASMTTIVLNVVGCEGCTVRAANAVKGRTGSTEAVVSQGRALITVPTASTPGLTFAIAHPQGLTLDGQTPMVVLGYPDIPVGTTVSSADAQERTQGSLCWSGVRAAEATLRFVVEVLSDTQMRVRMSPTGEVVGAVVPLTDGGYGSNEVPDCSTL